MCVDWVQILFDFKVRLACFHFQYTKNNLSDLPARYQCPRPELLNGVDEIRFVADPRCCCLWSDQVHPPGSAGSPGGARAPGEALVARLCTDTCCPSGRGHAPGASGWHCIPSV